MLCAYTVRYHDYAAMPIGEVANPDIHETIRENVSWESASTLIVGEAAKFVNELADAGKTKERSTDSVVSTSKITMTMM